MKRQQLYNSRGITLIALVITIIVMLILVAITLWTLTGENGILTKGYRAEEETNKVQAKELLQLAVTGLRLEAAQKGDTFDIEYIRTNLNEYLGRDDSITLSDLTMDVVSQDYQNITGTVKYEKKEYDYTIYWDNLQVAMEKVVGGKDYVQLGEQQTTFAVTVMMDGGDTTKGNTCQGGRVASGSGYPIYVIINPEYKFTGWEIVTGNATIVDASKPKTALENVASDVTVVAKYEVSSILMAGSDQILSGYKAYDSQGGEILGTVPASEPARKLTGFSGCVRLLPVTWWYQSDLDGSNNKSKDLTTVNTVHYSGNIGLDRYTSDPIRYEYETYLSEVTEVHLKNWPWVTVRVNETNGSHNHRYAGACADGRYKPGDTVDLYDYYLPGSQNRLRWEFSVRVEGSKLVFTFNPMEWFENSSGNRINGAAFNYGIFFPDEYGTIWVTGYE